MEILIVTLDEQIDCLQRAITKRQKLSKYHVALRLMTQEEADHEIATLAVVLCKLVEEKEYKDASTL